MSWPTNPKILLIDEPFGALDVQIKESMQEFLLELWDRLGISILMITHDVSEVVFLSQRIYALSARPSTIAEEVSIDLGQHRAYAVRRTEPFHHHCDEIMDLLRNKETVIARQSDPQS